MNIEEYLATHEQVAKRWTRRVLAVLGVVSGVVTIAAGVTHAPVSLRILSTSTFTAISVIALITEMRVMKKQNDIWKEFKSAQLEELQQRNHDTEFVGRLEELTEHLDSSRKLIRQLTGEINARGEALKDLVAKTKEQEALAALHADEAKAVDARIRRHNDEMYDQLVAFQKKESRRSFALTGVIGAFLVGFLTNMAFEALKPVFFGS